MTVKESIESLEKQVAELKSKAETQEPVEFAILSFSLPKQYKHKYDLIQQESNKKFSKLMLDIIKKAIDHAAP